MPAAPLFRATCSMALCRFFLSSIASNVTITDTLCYSSSLSVQTPLLLVRSILYTSGSSQGRFPVFSAVLMHLFSCGLSFTLQCFPPSLILTATMGSADFCQFDLLREKAPVWQTSMGKRHFLSSSAAAFA